MKHDSGCVGITKALCRGVTTGYYQSWLSRSAEIEWDIYNLVYLEYSRYGFIARQVKQNSKRLIVRVHNVEKDYYRNAPAGKKGLQNSLRSAIKLFLIANEERACLTCADCIICLTTNDTERLKELYSAQLHNHRIEVIPASIEQPPAYPMLTPESITKNDENPYLLITGSLWFGPNAGGCAWFIKNVWRRLQFSGHPVCSAYKLVIAGSKPGRELNVLASNCNNIELIDSPVDMKPYFENASIYLAPIFSGAGMKVKIAEALSYGLPVIGTTHAFRGYEITNRQNGYRADDATEFINALEHYTRLPVEAKFKIRAEAYANFVERHSIAASAREFSRILGSMNRH